MFSNLKNIKQRNGVLATILIYTVFLEMTLWCKHFFKFIRVAFLQPILNVQLSPKPFSRESLLSLRLPHPYNIIIHDNSQIMTNVTIFHEVTIGCIETSSFKAPIIEDYVYIGCKTACLGGIVIQHHTKIGAGSILLASTEPQALILGLHKVDKSK